MAPQDPAAAAREIERVRSIGLCGLIINPLTFGEYKQRHGRQLVAAGQGLGEVQNMFFTHHHHHDDAGLAPSMGPAYGGSDLMKFALKHGETADDGHVALDLTKTAKQRAERRKLAND